MTVKLQVEINPEVSIDQVILPDGSLLKKGDSAELSEKDWQLIQNKKSSGVALLVICDGKPLIEVEDYSSGEEE
jgi:hypothetical protein